MAGLEGTRPSPRMGALEFYSCGISEPIPSLRAAASSQVDVDVLLAREAQQFLDALLTPDAGLLVAAERRAEEMLRHLVDPHETRLDRRRRAMRGGEIVGPDRAGEPILHLIHLCQRLLLVAPLENGEDWTEDLFLGDAHVHGHIGEHRWLDIEALGKMRIAWPFAAGEKPGAVLLAGIDVREHAIVLHLAHDRTHGRRRIGWDAGPVALD